MSSILQRIARSVNWNATRQFTTSNTVRNAVESTPKPQGLYQFFENNETLPKQIWTGKLLERETRSLSILLTGFVFIQGRAWKAQELRQKSFDDLHKLWYVLLKERNVLATQREEARRLKLPKQLWTNAGRIKKVNNTIYLKRGLFLLNIVFSTVSKVDGQN
jgi:large subunit ribosomal protein L47